MAEKPRKRKCGVCHRMGIEDRGVMVHLDEADYGIAREDHAPWFMCHRCIRQHDRAVAGVWKALGIILALLLGLLLLAWRYGSW